MSRYRRGPDEVEAVEFDSTLPNPVGFHPWPDECGLTPRDMSWGYVDTPECRVHVQHGDWLVTESNGDCRVVKPEDFARLYVPA